MESINFEPIGSYCSSKKRKYELSRQPEIDTNVIECIRLHSRNNFEQALEGLEEFDRIWVLFAFHKARNWKPKVHPTRWPYSIGVFATRSPYRPCSIGMSCLRLFEIKGRNLYVYQSDLLDETPILDIKPYIPCYDSFSDSRAGWIDKARDLMYTVYWSELAKTQKQDLSSIGIEFAPSAFDALRYFIGPTHFNRIKSLGNDNYIMAYKEYRIFFYCNQVKKEIFIEQICHSSLKK